MEAPCPAARACHSFGYFGENTTPKIDNNKHRLTYDRQKLLELQFSSAHMFVNATTEECLRSLGVLRLEAPAAYEAADFPSSSTPQESTRRRCDGRRKRGCRGGLQVKLRANPYRMALPSVFLSNISSLDGKMDQLLLKLTAKTEIRTCCIIILTETMLNSSILDDTVCIEGFTTCRSDRSCELSGESQGGGLCIYINNNWCKNPRTVSSFCSPDIELLTVSCRPVYLPRELTCVVITAVHVPPSANTEVAMSVLYQTISKLQSFHTDGFFIVAGDFDQANMKTVLPHFHQHVDFATKGEHTPNMAFTNIKDAFRAASRPNLGASDYLSVFLIPTYKPLGVREKPTVRQVRVWSEGAKEALQDCFECTDWDMFKEAATYNDNNHTYIDIDEYATSVSAYISKCTDDVSISKNIIIWANQKPWMTGEVRKMIKARYTAFKSGDKESLRTAKANLKRAIKSAKRAYNQKTQDRFHDPSKPGNMLKGIGANTNHKIAPSPVSEADADFLNELNNLFERFEELNTTPTKKSTPHETENVLCLDTADVRTSLRRVNTHKAPGPDNIPGRVLRDCADQLACVLTDIFNTSLDQATVPSCFKPATITPVPKKPKISSLNDYQPFAPTPIMMDCFETLVKEHIMSRLPAADAFLAEDEESPLAPTHPHCSTGAP